MPIFLLPENIMEFPPPELSEDDGFFAVGGNLSEGLLLKAYSNGIFPWYNPGEPIHWWCPKERFVIFPEELHVSRSMRKWMRNTGLRVEIDADFDGIIDGCKEARDDGTWITEEMAEAYKRLFKAGNAMCAGVVGDDGLVGGLYGVVIGKCFFGESMFSRVKNASKLALVKLCEYLAAERFAFIDCQFHTEHLEMMGGRFITWGEYRGLLDKYANVSCGKM
jgi:leucyl/phenylalanyl-tRNA--protein transferase